MQQRIVRERMGMLACAFALASTCCGFPICYELQIWFFVASNDACRVGVNAAMVSAITLLLSHLCCQEYILWLVSHNQKKGSILRMLVIHKWFTGKFHNGFLSPSTIVRTWLAQRWQFDKVVCDQTKVLTNEVSIRPNHVTNDKQTRCFSCCLAIRPNELPYF